MTFAQSQYVATFTFQIVFFYFLDDVTYHADILRSLKLFALAE